MSLATAIVSSAQQAASYWPWLLVVPLAQAIHELTHFAVANWYGARPRIVIRLTRPMSVIYDAEAVSLSQRAIIGLAPTAAGLGLLIALVWLRVPLAFGPVAVILAFAWVLYTLPSRSDAAPAAELLGAGESLSDGQRGVFIAMASMAIAAWVPSLPIGYKFTFVLSQSLFLAALVYLGMTFWEHQEELFLE